MILDRLRARNFELRQSIYLSPRLNKEESIERCQYAKHLAEEIIELFGLDVVWVARIDSNLIESDSLMLLPRY
ncbi:Uncharacterized protein HZ326_27779 [Fusarium oxysporum f. sp. albedinis]|nr:Uncharacterized protein HZ326_27779 [Fusarium oxysporum f. sp. albedinis]